MKTKQNLKNKMTLNMVPKFKKVAEILRKNICDGVYPPLSKLPTIMQIAKDTQVNSITVDRALDELKAEGLIKGRRGSGNYVTERQFNPILPNRHLHLGLIWPIGVFPNRMMYNYTGEITRGILHAWGLINTQPKWFNDKKFTSAEWSSSAHGLTVSAIGEILSSNDRHPNFEIIKKKKFDGFIAIGIVDETWLQSLVNLNFPTVLIDYPNHPFGETPDSVFFDPINGYREAMQYFFNKGLTKIHFIGADLHVQPPPLLKGTKLVQFLKENRRPEPDSAVRLSAYRIAMEEGGNKFYDHWIHMADVSGTRCKSIVNTIMKLPKKDLPEAFICFNVTQAQALRLAFAEFGIQIEAAGASQFGHEGEGLPIQADEFLLGQTAASLLTSRFLQANRPAMKVGVEMRFKLPKIKRIKN